MKKTLLTVLLLAVAIVASNCGKPKPTVEETTTTTPRTETPTPVDTTSRPVEPPVQPSLQESQFQTVYFDFDQFNLRSDARAALDANYQLLTEFPDVIVRIEGHCDERGTVEYNLSLGEKRARSAMDYLVGRGLSANRASVISYGKERAKIQGSNEDAWAKNRRSEFTIASR
ncbi:MAG: OmpA family protein [candidate division Zixibacteria bacterium]|nr:OmpA family protein [candidate division Zixibacteria bacterium]